MTIKVEHITKVYGNKQNQCVALNDLSLSIQDGEFVAICGTSGSGKTTLFNIISGIDRKYEGDCYIDNVNIKTLSEDEMTVKRRQKIGVIFQFFNLISSLTVEENVLLSTELDGKKISEERLVEVLKELDLMNKRNCFISELSGGQQQRVGIARVLLSDAEIILADEPTGNLDSNNTQIILDIFKKLKEKHKTLIVITHDKHVANTADRIVYMKDGMISNEEL